MGSIEKAEHEEPVTRAERDENIKLMHTKLEPHYSKPDPSLLWKNILKVEARAFKASSTRYDYLNVILDAIEAVENLIREQSDLSREKTDATEEQPKDLPNNVSTTQRGQEGKGPGHGVTKDATSNNLLIIHEAPKSGDCDAFDWPVDAARCPGIEVSTPDTSDQEIQIINELAQHIQSPHNNHDEQTSELPPIGSEMTSLDVPGDALHHIDIKPEIDTNLEPTAVQVLPTSDKITQTELEIHDTEKNGKKRSHASYMTTNGEAKRARAAQKDEM